MDQLVVMCILVAVAVVLIGTMAILFYRRRTRRTIEKLGTILDKAISGDFSESIFDESELSAVEAKMARFMSICTVSSKNLTEERNKIKSLISDISHQTKTPIANILLYSQLLNEKHLPEDCAVCVKALSAQAEKLNFLISSLVKASRLETGIISVLPKQENVQRLIEQAVQQIIPKADEKGISVSVENTEIQAGFDLKWTTEALYNILDNAVKYTDCGGAITVKAAAYELFCRIDVTDNGIGIEEEEHSKIFIRFYRSTAVSNQEGVGIGLYLAREIVSAEGGYIRVSSTPGSGSTFSVFLPMV
ncbi:HAMP domain-containing histidine kinase [Dehalobacter sp. DCM]|uniref:sensor histidine kinase n=1 Tax=Dehalobacter sp. DCM TaxID=2907827 RepID=UPI003081C003|nr:HAMP domain-containing histidine kinase [Dehalobacter sp. DCM]